MLIYAGIDEAGYGPMFGPLVLGRSVFIVDGSHAPHTPDASIPDLWQLLSRATCRDLRAARRGRIAINDSKKLHSGAKGLAHLEIGVLACAALAKMTPRDVAQWLNDLGETAHHDLKSLPWYAPDPKRPWAHLPCATSIGELRVAQNMLGLAATAAGVVIDLGARIVFEDRFNRMAAATRSKSSVAFTFVADHLHQIWKHYGHLDPFVVVDRQSGRTRYRPLLATSFPNAQMTIVQENHNTSVYQLRQIGKESKFMTVQFQVDAEQNHMPVALASMISKYTRELLMTRFKTWFSENAPTVKPTAGYARDAQRFWQQIQPFLPDLSIEPDQLKRTC